VLNKLECASTCSQSCRWSSVTCGLGLCFSWTDNQLCQGKVVSPQLSRTTMLLIHEKKTPNVRATPTENQQPVWLLFTPATARECAPSKLWSLCWWQDYGGFLSFGFYFLKLSYGKSTSKFLRFFKNDTVIPNTAAVTSTTAASTTQVCSFNRHYWLM